ncbi:hypothetical protein ACFVW5_12000 [Streptomyces sp. NPDC058232]|uniref:hypothetical protein n=1 Tax=Streptomyces sp. NPDC058232 TaxID=3346393 RepID=UPI0036ECB01F
MYRTAQELEAAFRVRLGELGATLLESRWLGVSKRHRVRCVNGHDCHPQPVYVLEGIGICRACAGLDSALAFADFQAALDAIGARLIEPTWRGSGEAHPAICVNGHACAPRPCHVKGGRGICRNCIYDYDVFYVAVTPEPEVVKLGITTGDPRPRLQVHARDGLSKVIRLHTKLPDGQAADLERTVLRSLRAAGERPARGREYFQARVLPIVLDIVDRRMSL